MKYKVIFDTNSIRSTESLTSFLGGRSDLDRFAKLAEVVIPEMVIEEIKSQKKKYLHSKRDAFISNPFHLLRNLDRVETENFDVDNWVLELLKKEVISFTVISLSDDAILDEIKRFSLQNIPPFDRDSDKGFKDVIIYFTTLQYLNCLDDKKIFFVTKDERLALAFSKHERIQVIKDFDEFEKFNDSYFKGEYFINRLKELVDSKIVSESVDEIWLNIDENWVLRISCGDAIYFVEADFSSREIIEFTSVDFSVFFNELITSDAFRVTHSGVKSLMGYLKYLSDQQIQDLIKAASENDQIFSISTDEDVKGLFDTLYRAKYQIISEDLRVKYGKYFLV